MHTDPRVPKNTMFSYVMKGTCHHPARAGRYLRQEQLSKDSRVDLLWDQPKVGEWVVNFLLTGFPWRVEDDADSTGGIPLLLPKDENVILANRTDLNKDAKFPVHNV